MASALPSQPTMPISDDAPGAAPSPPLAPGDEAAPGTPGTGETLCPDCGGSGRIDSHACPNCSGSGKVIVGIGGA